jgi:hypothetical protein
MSSSLRDEHNILLFFFFFHDAWTMYEFLFEACILMSLNCVWKKNSLWFYDFTIRFYDPSLFYIFYTVLKIRFWQPWSPPFPPHIWSPAEGTISTTGNITQHSIKEKLTNLWFECHFRSFRAIFVWAAPREVLSFIICDYQVGSAHPDH